MNYLLTQEEYDMLKSQAAGHALKLPEAFRIQLRDATNAFQKQLAALLEQEMRYAYSIDNRLMLSIRAAFSDFHTAAQLDKLKNEKTTQTNPQPSH